MKKQNIINFISIVFIICFTINGISFAKQSLEPTLKEIFLVAWEKNQRSLPTTVTLKKTEETGIYNYETTLFPYKGQLKILNVIVSKDLNYYYDYDLNLDNLTKGVVEIELYNLPNKEFSQKHYYSHSIWLKHNFLFFNEDSKTWLNAQQWRILEDSKNATSVTTSQSKFSLAPYKKMINRFAPLLILILLLVPLILWGRKTQKKQIKKFDISMERQSEAIKLAKEGYSMQKQSLEIQIEQSEILRKIYEENKKA